MDLQKIQHLIQYFEANYQRTISTKEIEQVSHYSYRNIQRIFKQNFHESMGAFQKRLKLENAYKKLIYTTDSITDIAFGVGFESLHAFSKSFKKQFGIAPQEAKQAKTSLFEDFLNKRKKTTEKIPCTIIFLDTKKVYYKSIKTENYNNGQIDLLWDEMDALTDTQTRTNFYGIIVDQPLITDKPKCRYEAAIDVSPTIALVSKTIFGGRYAVFTHLGSYDTILDTYRKIYFDWVFHSDLEFDNSPIIENYTLHSFNADQEADFQTEILVPLKRR